MNPMELDGNLMKLIITNGSIKLKNNHQYINDLNVFPVPDGDTGSNMQSTMMSGVRAIEELEDEPIEKIGKALSRGLLMGARGNSGVILSQLFSGFAKAYQSLDKATAKDFIMGLKQGVKQAYGAVINPVEGTILTVAREACEEAEKHVTDESNVIEILKIYLERAQKSLEETPEHLPVLKESGVVDSGGAGLIVIIEGMLDALNGEIYQEERSAKRAIQKAEKRALKEESETEEFGYCTEFIIQLENIEKFNKEKLVKQLNRLGDSIVVVADEEICKVHVHTTKPGDALNIGQNYGEFANLKIENMTLQHTETQLHAWGEEAGDDAMIGHDQAEYDLGPRKKYGLITVVNGEGLKTAFKELGVNYVIDGGQTMNPSTQDFIDAVERVNADNIIIIPNNKNVMLSAEHAAKEIEEKNVIVIPAKTIPQGYASLTMFDANAEIEEAIEEMKELIDHVKTGEITYAVRDTKINDLTIKKDDFLGIKEGKIVSSKKTRLDTAKSLMSELVDDESEIVTIIVGENVDKKEVEKLRQYTEESFSEVEVEIIIGDQSVYAYLIAVE